MWIGSEKQKEGYWSAKKFPPKVTIKQNNTLA